ncbi:MAG: hypothetical protein AABO57_23665 [Acidobacteriota bacterium]
MDATVACIQAHATEHDSDTRASRQMSASKSVARDSLLAQLEAINRTSRVLAPRSPGLEDKFRMPLAFPAQDLLKAARSFLANATPLKADFIREELPRDSLEELTAAISDFETSNNEANRTKGAKVSAHAAQDEHVGEGMSLLQQLDVNVRNKLSSDRAVLPEWASASQVERHSSSGEHPDNPPGPMPPTSPPSGPPSGLHRRAESRKIVGQTKGRHFRCWVQPAEGPL